MTARSKDELHKIAEADDLHTAPFREGRSDVRHPQVDLGLSPSATRSTSAATTAGSFVGTGLPYGKRPVGSRPPG